MLLSLGVNGPHDHINILWAHCHAKRQRTGKQLFLFFWSLTDYPRVIDSPQAQSELHILLAVLCHSMDAPRTTASFTRSLAQGICRCFGGLWRMCPWIWVFHFWVMCICFIVPFILLTIFHWRTVSCNKKLIFM